jgi:hypothetical protein
VKPTPRPSRTSEAAILARVVGSALRTSPPEVANALLAIRLGESDLDRMHVLVTKNQEDLLTPEEKTEMESYRRVGWILDLLHSVARRSLKEYREAD